MAIAAVSCCGTETETKRGVGERERIRGHISDWLPSRRSNYQATACIHLRLCLFHLCLSLCYIPSTTIGQATDPPSSLLAPLVVSLVSSSNRLSFCQPLHEMAGPYHPESTTAVSGPTAGLDSEQQQQQQLLDSPLDEMHDDQDEQDQDQEQDQEQDYGQSSRFSIKRHSGDTYSPTKYTSPTIPPAPRLRLCCSHLVAAASRLG